MGAFHLGSKWAPAKDVDLTYTSLPYDNDWIGVIWRYVDHNNYYCFIFREEVTTVPYALHRRRNGVVCAAAPRRLRQRRDGG